ncbi:MGMT family protein [Candidatus Cardinium hertigii]|uniref:Methylated-DNA--protein-cysteine methyltransferase n=1 Tax=Candidatus Cardinium hertigii TaxID=247481 RepID=A0A2Z3LAB2_9BACT|nr:Methylated-DNA--protein-cysteine methyltransferase [Candidatus Cardinium hertigii]
MGLLFLLRCHRVIQNNGSIRGYAAGITLKQTLLKLEQKNRTLLTLDTEDT